MLILVGDADRPARPVATVRLQSYEIARQSHGLVAGRLEIGKVQPVDILERPPVAEAEIIAWHVQTPIFGKLAKVNDPSRFRRMLPIRYCVARS